MPISSNSPTRTIDTLWIAISEMVVAFAKDATARFLNTGDGLSSFAMNLRRFAMKLPAFGLFAALTVAGHTDPGASGEPFRGGTHIMLVAPHPEDLQGFTHNGWWGTYIIRLPGVEMASQWFLVLPLSQSEISVK